MSRKSKIAVREGLGRKKHQFISGYEKQDLSNSTNCESDLDLFVYLPFPADNQHKDICHIVRKLVDRLVVVILQSERDQNISVNCIEYEVRPAG